MSVQSPPVHKVYRGDADMKEQQDKYDATYQLGNTTVYVVSPGEISEEEKETILDEFHAAGWAIIQELQEKNKT